MYNEICLWGVHVVADRAATLPLFEKGCRLESRKPSKDALSSGVAKKNKNASSVTRCDAKALSVNDLLLSPSLV